MVSHFLLGDDLKSSHNIKAEVLQETCAAELDGPTPSDVLGFLHLLMCVLEGLGLTFTLLALSFL